MPRSLLVLSLMLALRAVATSQIASAPCRPVHLTAEQDHQRMMDLLHIQSLRPGADPKHPDSPNAVNYDEAKANPYPDVPDPLRLENGREVTTANMWWQKRRPELIKDFDRDVYGRVPSDVPAVHWEVSSSGEGQEGDIPVIKKSLVGQVDNSGCPAISVNIELTLTTPAKAAGAVPVILELSWKRVFTNAPAPRHPTWQEQVLAKGWGYAEIVPTSIQPDNGAGLTEGIIGLANKGQPRKLDDWGALRAWAWGASRALDYFETDKSVDAHRVGVTGHSRYGKAALVAMAYDQRFAIAYISSSGEGGARLHRRNSGEILENVAGTGEYHWMAGNFLKYAGPLTPNDLPVDSHELIALCAPRPVFIGVGSPVAGDGWADGKGMFLAAVAAGPVYRLLSKQGLETKEFPPAGTALMTGSVAFREHLEGHTPAPNWPYFLNFAGRFLGTPDSPAPRRDGDPRLY